MSLLCRLKKLVHKGILKKEDLDRIVIMPKEQGLYKWIPTSERMPEDGDEYIITIRERWGEDEEWDYETTTAYYQNGKWSPSYDVDEGQEWEVIAWMLLPEPYKAESEDKHGK